MLQQCNHVCYKTVYWHLKFYGKLQVKKQACLYSAYCELLISRRSCMACVNEGSHSFTWHPHIYLQVEWSIQLCIHSHRVLPHFGWYSFPILLRVGGWVRWVAWRNTEVVCPPKDGPYSGDSVEQRCLYGGMEFYSNYYNSTVYHKFCGLQKIVGPTIDYTCYWLNQQMSRKQHQSVYTKCRH